MTRTSLLLLALLLLAACPPTLDDDDTAAIDDDDTAAIDDDDTDDDAIPLECQGVQAQLLYPEDGAEELPTALYVTVGFTVDGEDELPPDVFVAMSWSPTGEMGSYVTTEGQEVADGELTLAYDLAPRTTWYFESGWYCPEADLDLTLVSASFTTGDAR